MITFSKCYVGLLSKNCSILDFNESIISFYNNFNSAVMCINNSVVRLTSSATGGTYGDVSVIYNTPTAFLIYNNSSLENLKYSKMEDVEYGVVAIDSSSVYMIDNQIKGKSFISSSTGTYSGCLSQTSVARIFRPSILNYGSMTGQTGPAPMRASLAGTIIVGTTGDKANTSKGIDNGGYVFVDSSLGGSYGGGNGIYTNEEIHGGSNAGGIPVL